MASRETAQELALRRELEREERLLACEEAIYLRDGQSGVTSTGEGRAWQAQSWAVMLDEVPPSQIVTCAIAAMKAKPNSYKISARDVLARFRREEWETGENGQTERVACANGGAYETWDEIKARAELMASHALPEPLPPLEVDIEELKRRLGIVAHGEGEESVSDAEKSDDPDVKNYGPLAVDIAKHTGIDLDACTPNQIADLRAFGAWWLKHHPSKEFNRTNFASLWKKFGQWREARHARKTVAVGDQE